MALKYKYRPLFMWSEDPEVSMDGRKLKVLLVWERVSPSGESIPGSQQMQGRPKAFGSVWGYDEKEALDKILYLLQTRQKQIIIESVELAIKLERRRNEQCISEAISRNHRKSPED